MAPQTLDITRTRGDTYPVRLVLKDKLGTRIDLTGWSFRLTVDPSPAPADAASKVIGLAAIPTAPETGAVALPLTTTDAAIAPGTYYFDVEATDAAGFVRTLASGRWTVIPDITQ